MKKILTILFLLSISSPAQAITWKEFWEPFDGDSNHHHHHHYYHRNPRIYVDPSPPIEMCKRRVYREEYVPGTQWNHGYVKRWQQTIKVPCY